MTKHCYATRNTDGSKCDLHLSQVSRAYNNFAPFYGLWWYFFEQDAHKLAVELACLHSKHRVIDVGIGAGHLAAMILPLIAGGYLTGVDISSKMIRLAHKRLASHRDRYKIVESDAKNLPVKRHSQDRLFCAYVLELIPEDEWPQVFSEFRRVLHPEGIAVLLTYAGGSRRAVSWWQKAYRRFPHFVGKMRDSLLLSALTDAGFKISTQREVCQHGLTTQIIQAKPN